MIKDAGSKSYSFFLFFLFFYWLDKLMYKNGLLLVQQKILQKAKERYSEKKSSWVLFTKQRTNKRKDKELIQKLVKRRKRQD